MKKQQATKTHCPCGQPLEEKSGAGRPATYCSTSCRRAAEFEIRRLDKLLARLEDSLVNLRLGYFSIDRARESAQLAAEIGLARIRMAALLAE